MTKRKLSLTENIVILLFFILLFGSISVFQGITIDYDFLHYHLYNPFAFLTGRINTDLAPCGIHSFFNPVFDIPYYLMFKSLINSPPLTFLIAFCQGLYCGIFAFVVLHTNIFFFQKTPLRRDIFYAVLATFIGISDCFIIATFNTTCNDIQTSILNLLALLLLAKNLLIKNSPKRTFYIILSSFLIGLSFGFKINTYIYTLFFIILLFYKKLKKKKLFFQTIILFLIFSIIGFLIADGYFIFIFLNKMHNTLFPNISDLTFVNLKPYFSHSIYENFNMNLSHIFYINPFTWSLNPYLVEHTYFFDFKHILNCISFAWLCMWFTINKAKNCLKLNYRLKILLLFIFISYVLWSGSFCFLRYFFPTLVLSGTIIVLGLYTFFHFLNIKNIYLKKIFMIFVIFLSFINYTPPSYEKTHEKIKIPKLNLAQNSFVIFISGPLSYLIIENPNAKYTYTYKELIDSPHYVKYLEKEIKDNENIYIIGNKDFFGIIEDIEKTFNIESYDCKLTDSITENKETKDYHTKNIYICKAAKK